MDRHTKDFPLVMGLHPLRNRIPTGLNRLCNREGVIHNHVDEHLVLHPGEMVIHDHPVEQDLPWLILD